MGADMSTVVLPLALLGVPLLAALFLIVYLFLSGRIKPAKQTELEAQLTDSMSKMVELAQEVQATSAGFRETQGRMLDFLVSSIPKDSD